MGTLLLYIDPGTGTMLIAALFGILSTLLFAGKKVLLALRFLLTGGKAKQKETDELPCVFFSDDKRYQSTFAPLLVEMKKRKQKVYYWTASPDDPLLEWKDPFIETEFIGEGNRAYARLNRMKARVCLSTTPGLEVYQWKRSKETKTYVHILHAVGSALNYRMFGLDFFDQILVSGPVHEREIRELEAIRHLAAKQVEQVGCPYLDELKKRYDGVKKRKAGERTLLLSPSWGKSGLLSVYGAELIEAIMDTGYRLIIRPHPQSKTSEKDMLEPLMKQFPDGEKVAWDLSDDNFYALLMADLMITDFSGAIFDFCLVFDKPILYAEDVFDPSPYDAAWLDHPLWKYSVLSQLGKKLTREDLPGLKEMVDEVLSEDRYEKGRKAAREGLWPVEGEGAARTVDALLKQIAISDKER